MTRARDLAAFVSNADGDIKFDTDTLFIDSSTNRVGIGTSTPDFKLEVEETSASAFISVISSNTTETGVIFGDTDSNARGGIVYDNSDNALEFRTNDNSERMRILAGGGLTFNGDTAAANALDDYETGTWTPTLPQGGSATNNYSSYVKIGDLVTAAAYISASSIPNDNGQFQIGGLPFTAHSDSNYYAGGSLSYTDSFNSNNFTDPLVRNGGTFLYFHRNDGTSAAINNNNITGATRYLIFQVTYHTQI